VLVAPVMAAPSSAAPNFSRVR
jgi:hypothetical protein